MAANCGSHDLTAHLAEDITRAMRAIVVVRRAELITESEAMTYLAETLEMYQRLTTKAPHA
jgi:hypothetical protein